MRLSVDVLMGLPITIFCLLSTLVGTTLSFTFSFTSPPTQCGNTTVQWNDVGQPPYSLLLLPTGHLNPETRTILQLNVLDGNDVSFVLNYPSQSQFVAIMNDASGVGTGGTSNVMTVGTASDMSCLNKQQVSPKFEFFQSPANVSQCGLVDLSWQSAATGPIDVLAVIPGGQSFLIANVTNGSRSVDWKADLRAGTQVLFVVGDESGLGSGGSTDVTIVGGGDSSCLGSSSPSTSTAPTIGGSGFTTTKDAGPITTATGPGINSSSHNSKHTIGLIVGLVVGLIIAIICAGALFIFTRRARHLEAYHDIDSGTARPRPLNFPRRAILNLRQRLSSTFCTPKNDLQREMYQADPFVVPSTTRTSSFGTLASSGVLEPPPRVHPVYRHSTKRGLGAAYGVFEEGRQGVASRGIEFEQLDYRDHIPSDVSSKTLAELDNERAYSGRPGDQTHPPVLEKISRELEGPPAGLRLVTHEPDADVDTEEIDSGEGRIDAVTFSSPEGSREHDVGSVTSQVTTSNSRSSPTVV